MVLPQITYTLLLPEIIYVIKIHHISPLPLLLHFPYQTPPQLLAYPCLPLFTTVVLYSYKWINAQTQPVSGFRFPRDEELSRFCGYSFATPYTSKSDFYITCITESESVTMTWLYFFCLSLQSSYIIPVCPTHLF